MRLGGPLFQNFFDPDSWIAALRERGYRAAYCPVQHMDDLTLTRLKDGWFFLHPARLPVVRLDVRVEAVCPEAFSAEADVSLCPRVHANAFSRILRAAL